MSGRARGGRGGRGGRGADRGRGRGGSAPSSSADSRGPKPQGKPLTVARGASALTESFVVLTPPQLRQEKLKLLASVSAALIREPRLTTLEVDSPAADLAASALAIAGYDPEFVLKAALYARDDLNVRSTSNFLLAVASLHPECARFVRAYTPEIIRLPSDWIDVAACAVALQPSQSMRGGGRRGRGRGRGRGAHASLLSSSSGGLDSQSESDSDDEEDFSAQRQARLKSLEKALRQSKRLSLPAALRKGLVEKFKDFDVYQLAKYDKERSLKRKERKMRALARKRDRGQSLTDAESTALDAALIASDTSRSNKPALTMKEMIRVLHISEPTEAVMSILGRKYPATAEEFGRSRLPGQFDRTRAGKRMKLAIPETWETQVSANGNIASVWEGLMDNRKLPFMAMLRNLRNLILTGVSSRHHKQVQDSLMNEQTVAMSRQFPTRFFSAYAAIPKDLDDYRAILEAANKQPEPKEGEEKRRAKKVPFRPANEPSPTLFRDYRHALNEAVVSATTHNIKPIRGRTTVLVCVAQPAPPPRPGQDSSPASALQRQDEVSALLGLMCKYACEDCDLVIFGKPSAECPLGYSYVSAQELTREDSDSAAEGGILAGVHRILSLADSLNIRSAGPDEDIDALFPFSLIEALIKTQTRVDTLLVVAASSMVPQEMDAESCPVVSSATVGFVRHSVSTIAQKYRQEVNSELLWVGVNTGGRGGSPVTTGESPLDVSITGFSDSILRFVAERGDDSQLSYVEAYPQKFQRLARALSRRVDKSLEHQPARAGKGTQKKEMSTGDSGISFVAPHVLALERNTSVYRKRALVSAQDPSAARDVAAIALRAPSVPIWRKLRIFVSSTFIDMHAERDVLVRFVFPVLRERLRPFHISLFETDLRWGLTADDTSRHESVAVCVEEAARSDIFVGLLGSRYGWQPDDYHVERLYEESGDTANNFSWLESFPKRRSVTELEITQACLRFSNPSRDSRALFYVRRPEFLEHGLNRLALVPSRETPDFHRAIFGSREHHHC